MSALDDELAAALKREDEVAAQLAKTLEAKAWLVDHAIMFLETLEVASGVAIKASGLGIAEVPLEALAHMLVDKASHRLKASRPE